MEKSYSCVLFALLMGLPVFGAELSLVGTITSIEPTNSLAVIAGLDRTPIVLRVGSCRDQLCIRKIDSAQVLAQERKRIIVITRDGPQRASGWDGDSEPQSDSSSAEATAAAAEDLPSAIVNLEAYEHLNADRRDGEPAIPVSQEPSDKVY